MICVTTNSLYQLGCPTTYLAKPPVKFTLWFKLLLQTLLNIQQPRNKLYKCLIIENITTFQPGKCAKFVQQLFVRGSPQIANATTTTIASNYKA